MGDDKLRERDKRIWHCIESDRNRWRRREVDIDSSSKEEKQACHEGADVEPCSIYRPAATLVPQSLRNNWMQFEPGHPLDDKRSYPASRAEASAKRIPKISNPPTSCERLALCEPGQPGETLSEILWFRLPWFPVQELGSFASSSDWGMVWAREGAGMALGGQDGNIDGLQQNGYNWRCNLDKEIWRYCSGWATRVLRTLCWLYDE